MTGMINGRFHLLPQAEKRQGGMSEVRKAVDVLSPEGAYAAVKLLKRRDDEESTRIFLDRETASLRALTKKGFDILEPQWSGAPEGDQCTSPPGGAERACSCAPAQPQTRLFRSLLLERS